MTNLFEKNAPFIGTVISGKGGVGKSITTINTAAMLNDMGYKVAVIDADLGMANCATLLNEQVDATVCEWIQGKCSSEDVMQNSNGITLVTGADDPHETNLDAGLIMDALDQIVGHLKNTHDYILIDTPAGVGEMSLWALDTAQLGILVLVDEPAAISDVYRLCKYVYSIDPSYEFAGVVNFAANEESANSTFKRFNNILNYFLEKHCTYLGFVPETASVKQAVQKQNTLLQLYNENNVLNELEFIAQNIISYSNKLEKPHLKLVY